MTTPVSNSYDADGTTVLFPFTFEYIEPSDVFVNIDDIPQEKSKWSFANATTVEMNTAPAQGARLVIYRRTNTDKMPATFYNGSTIQAPDLNDNFNVALFVSQESQAAGTGAADDALQAKVIANSADLKADAAIDTADAAFLLATTIEADADSANTNATQALLAASNAESSASAALVAATEAENTASTAESLAVAAAASASSVESTAQDALDTANAVDSKADTAIATSALANTAAIAAVDTADDALIVANTAANSVAGASALANEAQATAEAADSNATSALNAANNAANDAATALSAASDAETKSDTAIANAATALANTGPPVQVSEAAPTNAVAGDQWWADTTANEGGGRLYVYTGSEWIDVSIPGAALTLVDGQEVFLSKIYPDTAAGAITFEAESVHEDGVNVTGGHVTIGNLTNAGTLGTDETGKIIAGAAADTSPWEVDSSGHLYPKDLNNTVGIGTENPTQALEVNGNVLATNFIGPLQGNADTATTATNATNADHASTADSATTATNAITANSATTAQTATNAVNLGNISASSYLRSGTNISVGNVSSSGSVTASSMSASSITGTFNGSLSNSSVRSAIASTSAGSVGSYAAMCQNGGSTITPGGSMSGSILEYTNFDGQTVNPGVSGTWRAMGLSLDGNNLSSTTGTMWLRYQ